MKFIQQTKKILETSLGIKIYRKLPFGIDIFNDLRNKYPNERFNTFIDVGANVGEYAQYIRENFRKANIYCIEPILKTFQLLKKNTETINVHCNNLAIGASKQELFINLKVQHSTMVSLDSSNYTESEGSNKTLEKIRMLTLEDFCDEKNLKKIDFLKIDTEGHDLEVLRGAESLLKKGMISFVQVEAGMNKTNTYHVPLNDIKEYLESFGYYIFGIYEQFHEWNTPNPILRRSDVVFTRSKGR